MVSRGFNSKTHRIKKQSTNQKFKNLNKEAKAMKLKRILSAILCAALLFTGTTLPVDAAISFNGGGGNTYPGSGAGKANWAWSPGRISSRFGYR